MNGSREPKSPLLPGGAEYDAIRAALHRLGACPSAAEIFGAVAHGFKVNTRLSEGDVARFENQHGIHLPAEHRGFLLHVGNGGAGPGYGVFKLGEMDDGWGHKRWRENDGFVGTLAEPFPHLRAWNDLAGRPVFDPSRESDQQYEDAYWAEVDMWEREHFWNPSLVNGAVPICHMDCAQRVWLVIAGGERGNVWDDGRADLSGLRPVRGADNQHLSFIVWYLSWLREVCARVGV